MNSITYITQYLDSARAGKTTNAFHGLLESPSDLLPELIAASHSPENRDVRPFLVKVIWQHRQPSVIPFLGEALQDSDPWVWKEALNGLVAFATPEAIAALCSARARSFSKERDARYFQSWLEEAIEQAREGRPDAARQDDAAMALS